MKYSPLILLVALVGIAVLASANPSNVEADRLVFAAWKEQYQKAYFTAEEEQRRFDIFSANLKTIREHNAGNHTWTMAMNHFGDLSKEEFAHFYLNKGMAEMIKNREPAPGGVHVWTGEELLRDVNWVAAGKVTGIKNQGQCGSCFAFSATAAIESAWAIRGGGLIDLSEQQIVDCDSFDNGCNGGLMDNVFRYVMSVGGQESYQGYPYQGVRGGCRFNGQKSAHISTYRDVGHDDNSMRSALNQQPVSIAVDAEQWQFYSGGYVQPNACGRNLDHGVVAVGYTAQGYIVRNSWGTGWGQGGYIYLAYGNTCGMLESGSVPIV